MKELGAKSITAIVVPEKGTAYQILALNTEKAHNLRERALEVIRMYKELAQLGRETEESYALEFEEPSLNKKVCHLSHEVACGRPCASRKVRLYSVYRLRCVDSGAYSEF